MSVTAYGARIFSRLPLEAPTMQLSLKAGQVRVWTYVRWVSGIQLGIFRFFGHGVQTRSRAQLCFEWTKTSEAECNSHRRAAEFLRFRRGRNRCFVIVGMRTFANSCASVSVIPSVTFPFRWVPAPLRGTLVRQVASLAAPCIRSSCTRPPAMVVVRTCGPRPKDGLNEHFAGRAI